MLNILSFFVWFYICNSWDVNELLLLVCLLQNYHIFFHLCLNPLMNSCRALPQQQQLHGLHLLCNWQQRLQSELVSERLRPAWAVQQAGPGEVHRRLPATRGRVQCEPTSSSVIILTMGTVELKTGTDIFQNSKDIPLVRHTSSHIHCPPLWSRLKLNNYWLLVPRWWIILSLVSPKLLL